MTAARGSVERWPLRRIIGGAVLIVAAFSVAAVVAGGLALAQLNQQRGRIQDTIDPAALQAQAFDNALLNQETGLRGYALSAQSAFLAPYTQGEAAEAAAIASLRTLVTGLPAPSAADLASVVAQARIWRVRASASSCSAAAAVSSTRATRSSSAASSRRASP